MTTVLLIRHGQSVTNVTQVFTGHYDVPLSPLGQEQARYVAERSAEFIVTRNRDEAPDGYNLIQTQTFWSEDYNDTFRLYQRAN